MTNVLVVGSGGREHALSWKLSHSSKVDEVFTAPGNGGTLNNVPIGVDQIDELIQFARKNDCFTVCAINLRPENVTRSKVSVCLTE